MVIRVAAGFRHWLPGLGQGTRPPRRCSIRQVRRAPDRRANGQEGGESLGNGRILAHKYDSTVNRCPQYVRPTPAVPGTRTVVQKLALTQPLTRGTHGWTLSAAAVGLSERGVKQCQTHMRA
jgi:hypothetical protein